MLHAVGIQLGVGDLKKHHGVDLHGDVVLGDDRLGRKVHHLLLQGHHLGHPLDERKLEVDAHAPHSVERAQTLDDVGPALADDDHIFNEDQQQ